MLKIRRPLGRLIFNMGIAIPGKTVSQSFSCTKGSSVKSHYNDVIIGVMASQITSLTIVYSTRVHIKVNIKATRYWPFVRGIHRRPVNSPHKGPVTWKMFPFDDVIMCVHIMMSSWKNNPHWGKGINNTYIHGLVQGCSISIANALEILQSCTKSSVWH